MPDAETPSLPASGHRRSAAAMTDAEVQEFLRLPLTMALATVSPGGQPHLAAIWYGFVDGELGFLTYRRSQKLRNIERDPRVTCLFEDGSRDYERLRGVQLTGEAVPLDGVRMERLAYDIVERYQGPLDDAGRADVRDGLAKRLGFAVSVARTASWDHAKVAVADAASKRGSAP